MKEETFCKQDEVSLKEHLETLIEANDRRYEQKFNDTKVAVDAALTAADRAVAAALAAQKEAVTKAEVAAEKRFESVNEFRNTLSDQQRNLMPRSEAEIMMKAMNEKVESVEKRVSGDEGRGIGIRESIVWIIGIGGVLVGISRFIPIR